MKDITPLWLFFGILEVLCALGLAFVKIDKAALSEMSHSNPGLALFRFTAWWWFLVSITFLSGVFFIAAGIGMVRL
jgi:hypothetical protein